MSGEAELEHALVLPRLDAVLSLLWIPESCRALAYRHELAGDLGVAMWRL